MKKNTRTLAVALAALVTFLTQAQFAQAQQPVISAVSGSTTQGALVTISGSSLNAEKMQGWDNRFVRIPTAWSFEGTSPAADGYLIPGDGKGGGVYDASVKLLGNQSIKFRTSFLNPTCVQGVGQNYNYSTLDDAASRNSFWLRTYVRFNRLTNWPTNFQKFIETFYSGFYFQVDVRSAQPGGNPSTWENFHDGVSHSRPNPGGQIQNNRWYAVELHWSAASPMLYEAFVDGVQVYSATPAGTNGSGYHQYLLFGVINACGTLSWDVEQWMDGMTVAQQRIYPSSMVEVGNSPNYSSATKKVQAVESIADNQVTFRLDTSGLGAGPYYVWVRNNAQQLSAAYFLTGGQVSGPAAPTNLRITP